MCCSVSTIIQPLCEHIYLNFVMAVVFTITNSRINFSSVSNAGVNKPSTDCDCEQITVVSVICYKLLGTA